jgi:nitrite reductase/ring-hydroxylating ferredoxin subunit
MSQESAPADRSARPTTELRDEGATRRGLLLGTGLAGVAGALAACGGGGEAASGGAAGESGGGGGGGGLGKAADIPVGGGKVFADQGVVITQPQQGQFKAFDSKCTHKGCPVTKVENGQIVCPCHNSKFSVNDGSPAAGPAKKPLAAKGNVTVENGDLKLA